MWTVRACLWFLFLKISKVSQRYPRQDFTKGGNNPVLESIQNSWEVFHMLKTWIFFSTSTECWLHWIFRNWKTDYWFWSGLLQMYPLSGNRALTHRLQCCTATISPSFFPSFNHSVSNWLNPRFLAVVLGYYSYRTMSPAMQKIGWPMPHSEFLS